MSHKTHMNGSRESYSGIVPAKQSNESQGGPKEIVEGRPLTKENAEQSDPCRTQGRESGQSGLERVRQAAKGDSQLKFTAASCQFRSAPQQLLQLEKAGCSGCGRSDMASIWRRTGGTVNGPPWTNSSRSISRQTVAKSLDTENRRAAASVGNCGAGG